MPVKYKCSNCQGTFEGKDEVPTCPTGLGMMVKLPSPLLTAATGCKRTLDEFQSRDYSYKSYVPSTGRGKFDCHLDPRTGVLTITVRFGVQFETSWGFSRFSSQQELDIKNAFAESVPQYWNNKAIFRCNKEDWNMLVRPRFRVEFGKVSGAHFRMVITKESEQSRNNPVARECRGFVSLNQVTSSNPESTQDRIELRDFHVADFSTIAHGMKRSGDDREFLEQAIVKSTIPNRKQGNKVIGTLTFANNSDSIDSFRGQLDSFVLEVRKQLKGTLQVPMIVKGNALGTETNSVALAGRRAEAVRNYLNGKFSNPIRVDDATGAGQSTADLFMDYDFEGDYATGDEEFTYNTSAHEFGHLIGLPDEYENPVMTEGGDNSKAKVKLNYLKLTRRANVRSPEFPSHTSSMMSDGMTLMPWHMVTVWEALGLLSLNYLSPTDWEIHVPD